MLDSYENFFSNHVNKETFFDFGLIETIYIPTSKVEEEWEKLKTRIKNNEDVQIRGFGRDAKGTDLFIDFYKNIFKNEKIIKDPTNNHYPRKLIETLTGYRINKDIQNYQISHIFGRTKNIFAFTAPWNIVFMPKILDPLTGHESKGKFVKEFQILFQKKSYTKYQSYIEDFNDIVTNKQLNEKIKVYIKDLYQQEATKEYAEDSEKKMAKNRIIRFEKALKEEFSPIIMK